MAEHDTLYKISINPYRDMELKIYEYEVTNETDKSLMVDGSRFPKSELDKPIIDHYNRWFHGSSLTMYETTREEVEEFGVPKLKEATRKWLQENADYYLNFLTKL